MATLAKAFVQIVPTTKGIEGALSSALSGEANNAGTAAGEGIVSKIKGAIAAAGIGAAITKVVKDSLDAGGDLQQSFGGLETLYGDAAEAAKGYAYEAAQAGISANDYAEQAVSFGAGLKAAFGGDTQKAVEAANTAIMDMADNAAKMGTPIESIQNAYQGFAKGNYTMLDNLKLGYGGTKQEMERLLKDAEKLSGVKYDMNNLGDVYDAIHVVQQELGLTGVAADEAKTTLQGSFNSMKAAATNLLANMALGENIKPQLTALATSTKNYLVGNLLPMIGNIIKSVPTIFSTVFEMAANAITGVDWIAAGQTVLGKIKDGIAQLSEDIPQAIQDIGNDAVSWFESVDWNAAGQAVIGFLKDGIDILFTDIPNLIMDIAEAAIGFFKLIPWLDAGRTVVGFIANGIMVLVDTIPNKIKEIAERAVGLFKLIPWLDAGKAAIGFLADGVRALINNVPDIVHNIAETAVGIFKLIPWRDAGKAVIEFISTGISTLASLIPDAIVTIGSMAVGLFKLIPWLDLGKTIIEYIGNGITMLISHIPEILVGIGETAVGLFQLIPWRDLGKAIIDFIGNGISDLIDNIPQSIKDIGETAVTKMKAISWRQLGKDVIDFIVNGLTDFVKKIPDKLKEIGDDAKEKLKGISWANTGHVIITKIKTGLQEFFSKIPNKLKEIAKDAVDKVKEIDWLQLGKDIINGIADGIKSLPGALAGAVTNAATGALNAAKKALGINSPSKVFRDTIGLGIAEGILVGFNQGMDDFTGDMVNRLDRTQKAMAANMAMASNYTVSSRSQQLEQLPETLGAIVVNGMQQVAEGVERGIGNMKMVANNREYGRFMADLGFVRA